MINSLLTCWYYFQPCEMGDCIVCNTKSTPKEYTIPLISNLSITKHYYSLIQSTVLPNILPWWDEMSGQIIIQTTIKFDLSKFCPLPNYWPTTEQNYEDNYAHIWQ